MEEIDLDNLTKQWILTMLYDGNKTLSYLMEKGCKIMIYGHESFDEIERIIEELENESQLKYFKDTNSGITTRKLTLTAGGTFIVKKNTILPLLKLATKQKYRESFIEANKEKCDIEFIELLSVEREDQFRLYRIVEYTKYNFKKLLELLSLLLKFEG